MSAGFTREGTQRLIDEVLSVYPEKTRKERARHVRPNDATGESKECQVKSNVKSRPGVMTVRGCAYAGSKGVVWGPVKDVVHISHGPVGCGQYSWWSRRNYYNGVTGIDSFVTMQFTSDFQERDIVFGGDKKLARICEEIRELLQNMLEGLENARALYRPRMMAVSTTCMAEVIGDDLNAFIRNAREKGALPADFPVPFAHTPSFVGSHITGYDNMMKGILSYLPRWWAEHGGATAPGDDAGDGAGGRGQHGPRREGAHLARRLNVIPGFDGYVGDLREVKRLLGLMGVDFTLLGDYADALDSPATGEYRTYYGGTPLAAAAAAPQAAATVLLQRHSTLRTAEFIASEWGQEVVAGPMPVGVRNTDRLLQEVSRLTGRPVPVELEDERGRLLDAMADSHAYVHGKRVALMGDPDLLLGLLSFLLELGAEPVHVVCTNGSEEFKREAEELLAASPYGREATVWIGKDMWHLRSLVFTEPVDLLLGPCQLKAVAREAGLPLVRVGFPVFDRHHLHRYPVIGYQGALNLLVWIVNTVLDDLDRTCPDHSFDLIR